jgi:hypothetical protein
VEFQQSLPVLSCHHGDQPQTNNISLLGEGCTSPECGMMSRSVCLGNLTGKEIKLELRSENQFWAGQNGTIKIAFSTLSMTSILLDNLSAEIWSWCSERDIFLTAQYIPGNENFNADHMSRYFTDLTEWKLKSEIFHRICNHFFLPDIDLFASRLNYPYHS